MSKIHGVGVALEKANVVGVDGANFSLYTFIKSDQVFMLRICRLVDGVVTRYLYSCQFGIFNE
jgi:hypothetical protein